MTEEIKKDEIKTEPRDINVLLHIPYSEMTEEEIESLVEWKSDVKAHSVQFERAMEEEKKASDAMLEMFKKQSDEDEARQNEFYQLSLARLQKATAAVDAIIKES